MAPRRAPVRRQPSAPVTKIKVHPKVQPQPKTEPLLLPDRVQEPPVRHEEPSPEIRDIKPPIRNEEPSTILREVVDKCLHTNQLIIGQVVAALTTATQTTEYNTLRHELAQHRRDQQLRDIYQSLGRIRPMTPRSSPYLPAQHSSSSSHSIHSLPSNTAPQPLTNKPKRDYTTMICHACGKTGHSRHYQGCTLHPHHRPTIKEEDKDALPM